MKEPQVNVGIMFEPQIEFTLHAPYRMDGNEISGRQTATYDHGRILWQGRLYDELLFEPEDEQTASFELHGVTIGINFHWERKEDQRFQGALKIIVENEKLTGINVIRVEDYLTSVISSEMSATASLELLKAHAVISRSWLLAQINKNKEIEASHTDYTACTQTEDELIRWFDREDHTRFDVCADDHCQRYQGITRASTDIVRQAIQATRGQVLMSEGKICDARFSKCCGGAFEEFQYCWEETPYPYLLKQRDWRIRKENGSEPAADLPDLTIEAEADRWIRTSPEAFCNTTDKHILSQVLNNYDQETTDFYRWRVEYTQEELEKLSPADYSNLLNYYNQPYHQQIDIRKIYHTLKLMEDAAIEVHHPGQVWNYDEQYKALEAARDHNSSTEYEFLKYLYEHGLRLPDKAQPTFHNQYFVQPDFMYDDRIVVFCDGTPHDKPEIQEDDSNKREVLEDAGYVVLSWHYATPLEEFIARYPDIFTPVK